MPEMTVSESMVVCMMGSLYIILYVRKCWQANNSLGVDYGTSVYPPG